MQRFSALGLALVALVVAGCIVLQDDAGAMALNNAASARAGTGSRVIAIQTRLADLGYLPAGSVSGAIDLRTRQAIIAFQGWKGFERDGVAGAATLARLESATRPRPLSGSGSRIEIHLGRQVALLIRGNRVERAIHVSTGASATPTPTGDFRVYRKERRSWSVPFSVWLPWTSYFTGGVAMHAYADVPAYPASHGCVRVPVNDAPAVYAFAGLGVPVRVVP